MSTFRIITVFLLVLLAACRDDGPPPAASDSIVLAATAVPASATVIQAPSSTPSTPLPSATPSPSASPSSQSTPTATNQPSPTPTPTTRPSATPSASPTTSPTPSAYPPLAQTPGDPQPYLQQFTLVSFYGSAEGAGMGILNFREPPQLLEELRARTAEYQALLPDKQALPAFHIIVTVADPWFGEDRNFNHHLSLEAVESWIALAEEEGIAVVLDIQPGHAPVQEEFERIRPFLHHPHVHLALDSEYTMERTPSGLYEIPGEVLGSLYAAQINPIQEQLQQIALEIGVNKVLILHQFENEMLPDKENVADYANVEIVIDSDGFGGPDKVRDYHQYASEPAFEYGGFKLYRNWDNPLLTPQEVLDLDPPPAVIIYQ